MDLKPFFCPSCVANGAESRWIDRARANFRTLVRRSTQAASHVGTLWEHASRRLAKQARVVASRLEDDDCGWLD